VHPGGRDPVGDTRPARGPDRPAVGGPAAALSLRAVSRPLRPRAVLSGIELDVPPESCVGGRRRVGSGKTTLARCIVGPAQQLDRARSPSTARG
jgi:ABC-type bacteriocin/lantibiotic exporter with double-glycine peptidase domain